MHIIVFEFSDRRESSTYCKILKVLNLKFNLINKRHERIKLFVEYAFKLQTAEKILPLTSFQMDPNLT